MTWCTPYRYSMRPLVGGSSAILAMVNDPMRKGFGFVLIGLSACAPQSAGPLPPLASAGSAPARPGPSQAPLDPVPPGAPAGPGVVITSEHITIAGKIVGSVGVIDRLARLQKIDELFVVLKADRVAWKAAHEAEPFPGVASLVVAPGTSGRAFASVFQTIAFAGFPKIHVAVSGRYYPTWAQVPGPPCGTPENPCPSGPPQSVLHVQVDEQGWRLRIPREDGPIDANGEGPRSSVESFRAVVPGLASTAGIGAITFHVAQDVSFSRLAPFLAEVVDLSERASLTRGVTVSVQEIDIVQASRSPTPIAAEGTVATGRLAPEIIQKVVRANFGEFRKCYERAIVRDPNAEGKAATRLVIGRDGTVSDARTTLSGNLPPEVGTCMEAAFRHLTFDAPSGGIVTVTYPIVFSPGG